MRPSILDPVSDKATLRELLPVAERIFRLYEEGADYARELKVISRLVKRIVGPLDLHAAFGSGDSECFARKLLIDWHVLPNDLSQAEMLELIEALCTAQGSPTAQEYWLKILESNTGDEKLSDLIF